MTLEPLFTFFTPVAFTLGSGRATLRSESLSPALFFSLFFLDANWDVNHAPCHDPREGGFGFTARQGRGHKGESQQGMPPPSRAGGVLRNI